MRFAGGPVHGHPVPEDQWGNQRIEVVLHSGLVFSYERGLWWEDETDDACEGEPFYGLVDADFDDVMRWAREVLRPC